MSAALTVYRLFTLGLSPLAPALFRHRVGQGKELPERLNERHARALASRPAGTLVWMHGASIGESKLLLNIATAMRAQRPALKFLFTSQTLSSAGIMASGMPEDCIHQMAPIDTTQASARFIEHWRPDLCVFAEGEVWPNLLGAAQKARTPVALVNARMTQKSITGWHKFPKTAAKIFAHFDLILAADKRTAKGLTSITGKPVPCTGNLKTAFARSKPDPQDISDEQADIFPGRKNVLLGASTHAGEEALLLEALALLPKDTCLILAPRHPDRADEITSILESADLAYARRSQNDPITDDTRVLLADTFGEMNMWYRAANVVYLGGGLSTGIGGHNPLEPLNFGKPVLTGPHTDNFADIHSDLASIAGIMRVSNASDVVTHLQAPQSPDMSALEEYLNDTQDTLQTTLRQFFHLLDTHKGS